MVFYGMYNLVWFRIVYYALVCPCKVSNSLVPFSFFGTQILDIQKMKMALRKMFISLKVRHQHF